MTTKKPLTEEEMIDARLAEKRETEARDAALSVNTLRQIVEVVDRIKADAALLATLTGRVLMPAAASAFRPITMWVGRAAVVLDLTCTSAEQMLAAAEALTAPAPDAED